MTNAPTLGAHYLLHAARADRTSVRKFYGDLLSCQVHSSDGVTANIPENIDLFEFPKGEMIGVEYVEEGAVLLSNEQHRLACWMEIVTDDPETMKSRLRPRDHRLLGQGTLLLPRTRRSGV